MNFKEKKIVDLGKLMLWENLPDEVYIGWVKWSLESNVNVAGP